MIGCARAYYYPALTSCNLLHSGTRTPAGIRVFLSARLIPVECMVLVGEAASDAFHVLAVERADPVCTRSLADHFSSAEPADPSLPRLFTTNLFYSLLQGRTCLHVAHSHLLLSPLVALQCICMFLPESYHIWRLGGSCFSPRFQAYQGGCR